MPSATRTCYPTTIMSTAGSCPPPGRVHLHPQTHLVPSPTSLTDVFPANPGRSSRRGLTCRTHPVPRSPHSKQRRIIPFPPPLPLRDQKASQLQQLINVAGPLVPWHRSGMGGGCKTADSWWLGGGTTAFPASPRMPPRPPLGCFLRLFF